MEVLLRKLLLYLSSFIFNECSMRHEVVLKKGCVSVKCAMQLKNPISFQPPLDCHSIKTYFNVN